MRRERSAPLPVIVVHVQETPDGLQSVIVDFTNHWQTRTSKYDQYAIQFTDQEYLSKYIKQLEFALQQLKIAEEKMKYPTSGDQNSNELH